MEIFNAKDSEKMLNLALKMLNWQHCSVLFFLHRKKCKIAKLSPADSQLKFNNA